MDSIETLFTIGPGVTRLSLVDTLNNTLKRTEAIAHLLAGDCRGGDHLNPDILADALDEVSGNLVMIRAMVNYWHTMEREVEA